MSYTGLRPADLTQKKPSEIRDELQHVLGTAIDDCILKNDDKTYGGKFATNTDLNINISPFRSIIGGKYHNLNDFTSLNFSARKASYIYASKNLNTDNLIPSFNHYDAVYPEKDVGTVLRYTFSETGNPQDTSGSSNPIATMTGCTQVDGWADYAKKGDGSTGYMVSANNNNFPTAAQERELDIVFTPYNVSSINIIAAYGSSANQFCLCVLANGNLGIITTTNNDTGYQLEIGKTYYISSTYNGTTISVYVNGTLVYTLAVTLATGTGVMYIFRAISSVTSLCNGIIHYLELRNKMRTPQQIAAISNKLCLPCHYTGYSATYPANDTTSGAHIYKFDDASGNTVTDENGTLNGTATGTTIVDSEIGLGKARRFNGTSDVVTAGMFTYPTNFTVIGIVKVMSSIGWQPLVGSYDGTKGFIFSLVGNNTRKLACYSATNINWVYSNSMIPIGITCFVAASCSGTQLAMYLNSPNADVIVPYIPDTGSFPLQIGAYGNTTNFFNGVIEYLAIIPRALSQPEIAQYYNALMAQKDRTLIDDSLPSSSISLGFARTGSSALIEYNDTDYKYMRNEGATKAEGNKRVFLGWKYFSGQTMLTWDNPFGTRKIKTYYTWAQDANGANESDVEAYYYNTSLYGVQFQPSTSSRIRIITATNGVVYFNGVWQTSGYLSCYAELL